MDSILDGMAQASDSVHSMREDHERKGARRKVQLGLLWLAENLTDDIVFASVVLPNDPKEDALRKAFYDPKHADTVEQARQSIRRAILKAASND